MEASVLKLGKLRRITAAIALAFLILHAPGRAQRQPALPELSRTVSQREFVSAVGRRAALLGESGGRLEAWVYPLKILRDLHLRFRTEGRIVPAETIARSVITRPESSTMVYSDASFQVRETLFVPVREPGAIITLEIRTERPLQIEVAFTPDFQLEWPAELGASYESWDSTTHAFLFAAQDHPYSALIGSPGATETGIQDEKSQSGAGENSFLLAVTEHGSETKLVAIAASLEGSDDAVKTYDRLLHDATFLAVEAANYYREYLHRTLNILIPDAEIQQAYDWARINLLQAVVENPLVGSGLIAGYGPSGEEQRPGFDWFFGRDALWSSLALDAEGDFTNTRAALEFLAKYQRIDGKIPHEVPQSASLVLWFEDYPYGYASADATPLFLIAMNDYVQSSGDLAFAGQKWDNIWRAYQFLNSTLDADGFAKNAGVGHGWIESGPLVPVRTEIYQAAVGIEAVRATSSLARRLGKTDISARLDKSFGLEKIRLNQLFWSPEKNIFAYAINSNNQRADERTVLPAVPMWFGLLEPAKAEEMIARFASPELQTDWGMRMLSSSSPKYAADGYHFGSVWPLFTGWASVGEYHYHRALPAFVNLRANALLALGGTSGHVTETLSGDYYQALATSTPQQIWSAAMIVAPLVRGLLGLETNASAGEIVLKPHVPADWRSFTINNLYACPTTLEIRFRRDPNDIWLETTRTGSGKCTLDFSPAISLGANVVAAALNGRSIPYRIERSDSDEHVSLHFEVPSGRSTLRVRVKDDFELGIVPELPPAGSASQGLRILSESWSAERDRLDLELAGVPGKSYEFRVWNAGQITSVEGAELDRSNPRAAKLLVRFPSGANAYVERRISVQFTPRQQAKSATQR
jgi:glycogen debranching enzyme